MQNHHSIFWPAYKILLQLAQERKQKAASSTHQDDMEAAKDTIGQTDDKGSIHDELRFEKEKAA